VPFADWTDPGIRQKLVKALGYASLDDAQFHAKMGMDAICYGEDDHMAPQFCKKLFDEQGGKHPGHDSGQRKIRPISNLNRLVQDIA
jgi:hypothetical protein